MFEDLYTRQKTIEKQRSAPLLQERLSFLRHLDASGAKRKSLQRKATNLLRLVYLLDLKGPERVSDEQIMAAAKDWSIPGMFRIYTAASPQTKAQFISDAIRWLHFLGWRETPKRPAAHPHEAEVAAFAKWAREERGYAEATIESCCEAADLFFRFLATSDTALAAIHITDIDRAFIARTAHREIKRITITNYAGRLRMFFRFAEDRGWCMRGIAAAITPPRTYVNESIPNGLKREDVVRLLATTEGNRPVDKRDRAILMLLIAYGLRSAELRGLQLDDLDWEKETLRVRRPKTGRTDLFPLSRGVAKAILRYVVDIRPSRPDRSLFFTLAAPIRPLSKSALGETVRKRLRQVGVVTGRRGPHTLRHAAAQNLLDQGVSMKEIGDFLGHRSASAAGLYAKVNLNALREVADFDLGGLA